jgi:hypothetical protein
VRPADRLYSPPAVIVSHSEDSPTNLQKTQRCATTQRLLLSLTVSQVESRLRTNTHPPKTLVNWYRICADLRSPEYDLPTHHWIARKWWASKALTF